MISTTAPSGRLVTLPAFGRFTGRRRAFPVTIASSERRDQLAGRPSAARRPRRGSTRSSRRRLRRRPCAWPAGSTCTFHASPKSLPRVHETGHELGRRGGRPSTRTRRSGGTAPCGPRCSRSRRPSSSVAAGPFSTPCGRAGPSRGRSACTPSTSSSSARKRANASSPRTVIAVASGKWFTPPRTASISCIPQSNRRLSANVVDTHSLHRPTVRQPVSRVTDAAQRGERVGDVEEARVGCDVLDVARDVEQHRDAAQRPAHAARADAVADRLDDAVPLGDLEIVAHAVEAADRERGDDEVGVRAAPCGGPVRRAPSSRCSRRRAISVPSSAISVGALVIEVVEDELGRRATTSRVREVGQQARAPSGSSRHPRRRLEVSWGEVSRGEG